jgi:predicted GNAT family N-acyltransferase
MSDSNYKVRLVSWALEGDSLMRLRFEVFVREQGVPKELEVDGLDPDCEHAAAFALDGRLVGTARLLPDGHIGRVAVARECRGYQVGTRLMQRLIVRARARGLAAVQVNAQCAVLGFYQRLGFTVYGEEFMEAGIAHRSMSLVLRRKAFTAPDDQQSD